MLDGSAKARRKNQSQGLTSNGLSTNGYSSEPLVIVTFSECAPSGRSCGFNSESKSQPMLLSRSVAVPESLSVMYHLIWGETERYSGSKSFDGACACIDHGLGGVYWKS